MTRDDGLAPLWLVGSILVIFMAFIATLLVVTSVMRSRTESIADLVALAAAREIVLSARPCDAAMRIATANSAVLLNCQYSGSRVEVVVTLPKPQALRRLVGKRKIRAAAAAEIYWVDESNFSKIPE